MCSVITCLTYKLLLLTSDIQCLRVLQSQVSIITIRPLIVSMLLLRNKKIIDAVDVDTPPYQRESTGFWLDLPPPILQMMIDRGIHPAEAIHAAEHAFLNRFALGADLGTECKAAEKEYKTTSTARKRPARYVVF